MSGLEEVKPNIKDFNINSPYYHNNSFLETNRRFEGNLEYQENEYRPDNFSQEDGTILLNKFGGNEYEGIVPDTKIEPYTPYTMVITYKHNPEEKKPFFIYYNSVQPIDNLPSHYLKPFSKEDDDALKEAQEKEAQERPRKMQRIIDSEDSDSQASQKATLPLDDSLTGGKKYIAQGGVGGSLVRRISASINDERARQTHERDTNFHLHRSFFLIIWEHFAPNDDIRKRPREYKRSHFTIKLPVYKTDGTFVCFVLLRCVTKRGSTNIAYSVLFEFTSYIHWSIFYSFDSVTYGNGQVSELHFTLNEYLPARTPKTRMFFEYTDYIDNLIRHVHNDMVARQGDGLHLVSFKTEQVPIMGIVSELMLLTMYQLATAKSYETGHILNDAALNMRLNIDSVGRLNDENELLKIALRHVDLIDCIQQEFIRSPPPPPSLPLPSHNFINHLKTDISAAATAAGPPAGRSGGKNINKYLTNINNIKERLKLLKKNKLKNKVKITKLSKSIEELKAKLKKQKEKEKAKLKKQKEKEKAKLKKQKEKEKAKLKKQKEKDNVKRKKTKAKKS